MSMCYVLMTDKPLPEDIEISCNIGDTIQTRKYGRNGSGEEEFYMEGKCLYDGLCIEGLKQYVPSHWYGMYIGNYDGAVKSNEGYFKNLIVDLEYRFNFIRELLKKNIDVWYIRTVVDDVIKKEDMVIREINVADLHFLDEKRPDTFMFERNVFYRFVLK